MRDRGCCSMTIERKKCSSCGAEIYWCISTTSGTAVPIDADPVENGNVLLSVASRDCVVGEARRVIFKGELLARVLKKDDEVTPGRRRYVSHFATCPNSKAHRKARSE